MKARDEQATAYDSHLIDRYHREIVPTLTAIGPVNGKAIVEHGAGTGRFTVLLAGHSGPYLASDISLDSLRVLAKKGLPPNVGLVCADATKFPTAPGFFDVALALQLIEHMPTLEIRNRFYNSVAGSLKSGGVFVASVYHQDLRRRMAKQPADGTHENGIPFHFFSRSEFVAELATHFSSVSARSIDITLPFEKRLRLSDRLEGIISRVAEYIPLVRGFGHLVLSSSTKR